MACGCKTVIEITVLVIALCITVTLFSLPIVFYYISVSVIFYKLLYHLHDLHTQTHVHIL